MHGKAVSVDCSPARLALDIATKNCCNKKLLKKTFGFLLRRRFKNRRSDYPGLPRAARIRRPTRQRLRSRRRRRRAERRNRPKRQKAARVLDGDVGRPLPSS